MTQRQIKGAVGLGGQVYRAGREAELAAAAAAAGVDLTGERFEGVLVGDWGGKAAKAQKPARTGPLAEIDFASDEAAEAAEKAGLQVEHFQGATPSGKNGFTAADVRAAVEKRDEAK